MAMTLSLVLVFMAVLSTLAHSALPQSVACPEGASAAPLTLDVRNLWSSFYLGEFTHVRALNAADCLQQAMAAQCEGFASEFYVFSPEGFRDARRVFLGNCAFGGPCVELKSGNTPTTVGDVPAAKCPAASGSASVDDIDYSSSASTTSTFTSASAFSSTTGQGSSSTAAVSTGSEFLPCPVGVREMSIDATKVSEAAGQGLLRVVNVATAGECQTSAQEGGCNGRRTGLHVFNEEGFKNAVGVNLGRCALAPACFPLAMGPTHVNVGSLDFSACPSSPLDASSMALRGPVR